MSFRDWMENFEVDLPPIFLGGLDSLAICDQIVSPADQALIEEAAALAHHQRFAAAEDRRERAGYGKCSYNENIQRGYN